MSALTNRLGQRRRTSRFLVRDADGAWRASRVEPDGRSVTDLSGNERHLLPGGQSGSTPTTNDPKRLDFDGERYVYLDGQSGNYARVEDVNLLDSRQASFDNVGFDGAVNPEDRYEVWGSGGGTGEGAHTDASPMLVDLESYDVAGGLVLDGADDFARTPHTSSLNVAGDIDLRAKIAPADWSPGSNRAIVAKYGTGITQRSYLLYLASNGALQLYTSPDGTSTNQIAGSSTANLSSEPDGSTKWVRVTLDVNDGAGNRVYKFYTSDDGITWSQLGDTLTVAGTTSIHLGTETLDVGVRGGADDFTGTIHEVQVRNGIDGPLVANPIFEGAHLSGGLSTNDTFIDGCGNTWTLNGNATIPPVNPKQVGWLPGAAGNHFSIPDTNLLDTVQSTFHNTDFSGTITPEDSYEVWGTGGGTAAGAFTDASPMLIDLESYDVAGGLVLDSTAGTYASVPDSNKLDVTGDIDLRVDVALDDWSPDTDPQALTAQYGVAGNRGWVFRVEANGVLGFYHSLDGTAVVNKTSTTFGTGIANGERKWVRVTRDSTTGDVAFYSSDDGENWAQLGSTLASAAGSIFNSTEELSVGEYQDTYTADGTIYEVQVRNGIDGPLVANPVFAGSHMTGGLASPDTFTDHQGNVWTLNGNATIPTAPAKQVGWLPGASGNYFSISDTNLLDADTAHLDQSKGNWTAATGSSSLTHETTGEILMGSGVAEVTAGGGVKWSLAGGGTVPATAGVNYSFAVSFFAPITTDREYWIDLNFRDAGDALLLRHNPAFLAQDGWVHAETTATAPTGTSYIELVVHYRTTDGSNLAAGETWRFDRVCLRQGSDPTFVPSTRIVGDIDIRARVALKDWTSGEQALLTRDSGSGSNRNWELYIDASGNPFFLWWDSGGTLHSARSTVTAGVSDRTVKYIRSTLDVDNGTGGCDAKFYTSDDGVTWTQLGSTVTQAFTTSIRSTFSDVNIGAYASGVARRITGVVLNSEIRDGIDGPVAASLDLTQSFEGNVTNSTSPEGHTATLNRSGDATTEMVEYDTWMFTGFEWLEMPDRDEIDFANTQQFELSVKAQTRNGSTLARLLHKRSGIGYLIDTSVGQFRLHVQDSGGGTTLTDPSQGNDGEFHIISGYRTSSDVFLTIDDLEVFSHVTERGDLSTSQPLVFGSDKLGNPWRGQSSWVAIFRRALTNSERSTLTAWDGQVSSEPTWLRCLAVFYINANDPHVKAYYNGETSTNEVLNLAAKTSNELGWQPANIFTRVQRSNAVGSVVGETALRALRVVDGKGYEELEIVSSPVGPVTPGQTYSATSMHQFGSNLSRSVKSQLVWFDSAGGEVGRTDYTAPADLTYKAWTRQTVTGVAPTNAVSVALQLWFITANEGGHYWYVDAVTLRQGADEGFIPSTRIKGDLDLRVRVAAKDWTPAALQGLAYKWDPFVNQKAYAFLLETDGTIGLALSSDGVTNDLNSRSTVSLGAPNRDESQVKATYDTATGEVNFYTSIDGSAWTQLGTSVSGGPTSLFASSANNAFGSADAGTNPFLGVPLYFEIRDGIDGPVVASLDLTKMFLGNGTSDTSPEGHAATLNRSGNATTEIIDRDCWARGDVYSYLSFPHEAEIDLSGQSDFAIAGMFQSRATGTRYWWTKGSNTTGARFYHLVSNNLKPWIGGSAAFGPAFQATESPGFILWQREFGVETFMQSKNVSDTHGGSSINAEISDTTSGIAIGSDTPGQYHWTAQFRRILTVSERSDLASWDGQVATEPSWLRSLATFYVNANDPWVKDYYDGTIETNSVLNLATAPYGELGWNVDSLNRPDAESSLSILRSNSVTPVVGSMVMRINEGQSDESWEVTSTPVGPISSGQTYSASGSIATTKGGNYSLFAGLIWYDDDGGEIGRDEGTPVNSSGMTWIRPSVEAVAPDGAAKVAVSFRKPGTTWAQWYLDAVTIREGADTGYIPSFRIRENMDVRFDVKLEDYTPDTNRYWMTKGDHSRKFSIYVNGSTNRMAFAWYNGSVTTTLNSGATLGGVDGERLKVRVAFQADNGSGQSQLNIYTKTTGGIEDDSGWTDIGGIVPTGPVRDMALTHYALHLFNYTSGAYSPVGDYYGVCIKDGINGPIVLDVDFTDESTFPDKPYALGSSKTTGHEVELRGRATLVTSDRHYLDGVDDFFSIPDDSDQYLELDGQSGSYAKTEDINLLDSRQASFDNVGFDGTVNPEDRYEVWGSGGGTGAGAHTDASPMLIDLDSYDCAGGLVGTDGATCPHNAKLSVSGDFTVVVDTDFSSTGSTQTLARRWGGTTTTRHWNFYIHPDEYMVLLVYEVGVGQKVFSSGANGIGPVLSGERVKFRAKFTADTGAGSSRVVFEASRNGGPWEWISTNTQAAFIPQSDITEGVWVPSSIGSTYELEYRVGNEDGPLVANPKFEGIHMTGGLGATDTFTDHQGNIWTLGGNATIPSVSAKQVGWLPGQAGNYFSIPDVNLFNANMAHFKQGIGSWQFEAFLSAPVHSPDRALLGTHSLKTSATSNNNIKMRSHNYSNGEGVEGISPGTQYSFSASFYSEVSRSVSVAFRWSQSDGTFITSSWVGVGGGTVAGQWVELGGSATAPANAARVAITIQWHSAVSGEEFYIDRACLRQGSDPTFVPSTRIVGDLEVVAKVSQLALDAITRGLGLGRWSNGAILTVNNGTPRLFWYTGSTTKNEGSSVALTQEQLNGDVYIKATLDVDNGAGNHEVEFFTSTDGRTWTQLGITRTAAGTTSVAHDPAPLTMGVDNGNNNPFKGVGVYSHWRDGIDGPVVASMDLTKQFEGNVTTSATPEGHAAVLNRSGSATTEIVNSDRWMGTGSEDLRFGLPEEIDMDLNSFEVQAGASFRYWSSVDGIIGTRQSGGSGWVLESSGDGIRASFDDGADHSTVGGHLDIINDGELHMMGLSREASTDIFSAHVNNFSSTASLPNIDSLTSDTELRVFSSVNGAHLGSVAWSAIFRRVLTNSERDALAGWNGQIDTEPSWLRPLAVFYINANDPWVKSSYANNEVLNLATAPYGELGWSIAVESSAGDAFMDRYNGITPTVGSMVLRATATSAASEFLVESSPVGPVTVGETYTGSMAVQVQSASTWDGHLELVWFDDEDGEIDREIGSTFSMINSDGWVRRSISAVAPANATQVAIAFRTDEEKWAAWYFDAVTIRKGTDTGYSPSLRIREDIDIEVEVALDDWTPAAQNGLISKAVAWGDASFYLRVNTDGKIALVWTPDGTDPSAVAATSTVAPAFTNGSKYWVRATLDSNNGSGGRTVTFYTSLDGESWTQLGTPVTAAGTTSIHAGANELRLGGFIGTAEPSGKFYSAIIKDGIGGPVVFDADFTDPAEFTIGETTGETNTSGHLVSAQGAAAIAGTLGTFNVTGDLTVVSVAKRSVIPSSDETVISKKWAQGSTTPGWQLFFNGGSGGITYKETGDEVANSQSFGPADEIEDIVITGIVRSSADDELYTVIQDQVGALGALAGDLSSLNDLIVGQVASGAESAGIELLGVAVFVDRVLTSEEIKQVGRELASGEYLE